MKPIWQLSVLMTGLILAALILRSGSLAALAIPIAVYMLWGLLQAPEKALFSASQTVEKKNIKPGSPVTIKLSLSNPGNPVDLFQLVIPVSSQLEKIEGPDTILLGMQTGANYETEYVLKGPRGRYSLPYLDVIAQDPFDLFPSQQKLRLSTQLVILPSTDQIPNINIRPRETRGYAGPIPANLGGSGTDFFDVRAYQLGDPLRRINWQATARHRGELFTNQYEMERTTDVGIILDARQLSNITVGDDALFEYSVHAAASLAESFLHGGNRVGILTYGFGLEWVFPGYGKRQKDRIMRALAKAEPGRNYSLETLYNLPVRLFPAHSQIVMVSPLWQADIPTLIRMRAFGYELLIVSPNPVSFELAHINNLSMDNPAVRIARLERRILLKKLNLAGILIVDWDVTVPLRQALHKVTVRQAARIHQVGRTL